MPFTTWIRDLFGIRKDAIDTKKAKLEVERLQAEKRERDLITPATLDDVKKYDPKTQALLKIIRIIIYIIIIFGFIASLGIPNLIYVLRWRKHH